MNNSRNTNAVNYAIVANCRLLIFQVPQVKVPHYFWETNRCVDALTRLGIQQASDVLYYNSSPTLSVGFFSLWFVWCLSCQTLPWLWCICLFFLVEWYLWFNPKKKKKKFRKVLHLQHFHNKTFKLNTPLKYLIHKIFLINFIREFEK